LVCLTRIGNAVRIISGRYARDDLKCVVVNDSQLVRACGGSINAMKLGNGEHSMNALQILNITDYDLFVDIKHSHQIRPQVCDVKSTVVAVQALIIETRRPASQWHINESAQGEV